MKNMFEFNSGQTIYWSNKLKCNFLQRQIIVHSILYYELSQSIITDVQFDKLCKQLLELQKQTKDYEQTEYYYVFKDFAGETGYYIPDRLNKHDRKYLTHIAKFLLRRK